MTQGTSYCIGLYRRIVRVALSEQLLPDLIGHHLHGVTCGCKKNWSSPKFPFREEPFPANNVGSCGCFPRAALTFQGSCFGTCSFFREDAQTQESLCSANMNAVGAVSVFLVWAPVGARQVRHFCTFSGGWSSQPRSIQGLGGVGSVRECRLAVSFVGKSMFLETGGSRVLPAAPTSM